ncbi:MAG: hypothetical protein LBJ37_23090 [Paucimonas sp.]|jgi:hypothetical protein|nr:hypothetical protein [Paucimonas sp.]
MIISQKETEINPCYVSELLNPLSLASAMENNVLDLVNYSDSSQCAMVVVHLVKPTFERVDEPTKQEIRKALRCLVENSDLASKWIGDKLLLCGVAPESFDLFLREMWMMLFSIDGSVDYYAKIFKIKNKPLGSNKFVFISPPVESLQQRIDRLREMLIR